MSTDQQTAVYFINIMLVDDHPAIRQGLRLLLAPEDINVCSEAGNQAEAQECLAVITPDVAVVDLSLDGESGLMLIKDLRERNIPSLIYSMHDDVHHVEDAFAAGALGYVTKRELHGVLVQAIREVARGHRFISPNAAVAIADHITSLQISNTERELSSHEAQVYELLGEGEGTIEIAIAMHISTRTVESYYTRIMDKLGIDGMRNLRRHAINHFHDHSE